jgi:hypothetical protein
MPQNAIAFCGDKLFEAILQILMMSLAATKNIRKELQITTQKTKKS